MKFQKRKISDIKEDIHKNTYDVQMMLLYWSLYPRTLQNRMKMKNLQELFHKIMSVFQNISLETATSFFQEQLFIIKYAQNCRALDKKQIEQNNEQDNNDKIIQLRDQDQITQSSLYSNQILFQDDQQQESFELQQDNISQDEIQYGDNVYNFQIDPNLKNLEQNFAQNLFENDTQQKECQNFEEISQDNFFELMIDFYLLITVNYFTSSFSDFWQYIFIKINEFYIQIGDNNKQIVIEQSLKLNIVQGQKNPYLLNCYEKINFKDFTFEDIMNGTLGYQIKQQENIQQIGQFFEKKINDYVQNFQDKELKIINKYLQQQKLFYVSFFIQPQNKHTQFSTLVYKKYLFEKAQYKDSTQKGYFNMIDQYKEDQIDLIERFDRLFNQEQDPYYIKNIKKCLFEYQSNNFKVNISRANKYNFWFNKMQWPEEILDQKESIDFNVPQQEQFEKFQEQKQNVKFEQTEFQILYDKVQKEDMRILLLGKFNNNKKQIGKNLCKFLNIIYFDLDELVEQFIQNKISPEQNEDDQSIQQDENENQEVEKQISDDDLEFDNILNGKELSKQFLITLIQRKINELQQQGYGFIFNLTSNLHENEYFLELLESKSFDTFLPFTYIINLEKDDQQVCSESLSTIQRIVQIEDEEGNPKEQLMTYTEDNLTKNKLQNERAKWFQEQEENLTDEFKEQFELLPEEFQQQIKDIEKNELINTKDSYKKITNDKNKKILKKYNSNLLNKVAEYKSFKNVQQIVINNQYNCQEELIKNIIHEFNYEQHLQCIDLEQSDLKDLIWQNKEEEQYDIARRWSYYQNVDPVGYVNDSQIQYGSEEFGVEYQNYIFLFVNEKNKNIFKMNPKKFLRKIPKIKNNINISLIAPDGCQIKTIAKSLSKKYNLQIVDLSSILKQIDDIIQNEKQDKDKKNQEESLFAQFYIKNISSIRDQIMEGKSISIEDLFKIFAYQNGEQFELTFSSEQEIKNLLEIQSKKKSKKQNKNSKPKNILLSEFSTVCQNQEAMQQFFEQIMQEIPEGLEEEFIKQQYQIFQQSIIKQAQKKGYIFINFPTNIETKNLLGQYGYQIDKVISFSKEELNEDNIYMEKVQEFFNLENHQQEDEQIQNFLQENYEDKNLIKIDIDVKNSLKNTQIQIEDFVNPFKTKIDSENFYRDYNIEEINNDIEPVLYYQYGQYCPYNLIQNNWFVKGSFEFQKRINNQILLFTTEQSQKNFSQNYQTLLNQSYNLDELFVQKSRYFILGTIGSGINIFSQFISNTIQLKIVNVKKQALEQKFQIMQQYVQEQYYRKEFDWDEQEDQEKKVDFEDKEYIIQEYQIEQELEDKIEEDIIRNIYLNNEKCIFNVDFSLNDQQKQIFKKDFLEIIKQYDLVFDHLIMLKSNEQNTLDRLYDEQKITEQFNKKIEQFDKKKQDLIEQKRQEIYKQKLEEIEDDGDIPQLEDIEVDENDIEMDEYPVLEDELEKVQNSIKERRLQQEEYQENLVQILNDQRSKIFNIDTDLSIEKIKERIKNKLECIKQYYQNCFRKLQIFSAQDSEQNDELTSENKIEKLIKSGLYKLSKFNFYNAYNPTKKVQTFDYNFIHKNQIYFTNTQQERDHIINNVRLLENLQNINIEQMRLKIFSLFKLPQQIKQELEFNLQMQIFSFGKILEIIFNNYDFQNLKVLEANDYQLKFSKIDQAKFQDTYIKDLYKFKNNSFYLKELKQKFLLNQLDDNDKVYLLKLWMEIYDCKQNGLFITNFPENLQQAKLIQSFKINPDMIISTQFNSTDIINDYIKNKEQTYRKDNPLQLQQLNEDEDDEEKLKEQQQKIQDQQMQYEQEIQQMRQVFAKSSIEHVRKLNTNIKLIEYFYSSVYQNLYILDRKKSKISNYIIISKLIQRLQQTKLNFTKDFTKDDYFISNDLCIPKDFISNNTGQALFFNFQQWIQKKELQIIDDKYLKQFYYDNKFYYYDQNLVNNIQDIFQMIQFIQQKANSNLNISYMNENCQIQKLYSSRCQFQGYCCICLSINKFEKGHEHLSLELRNQMFQFCSIKHFQDFTKNPILYTYQRLDENKLNKYLQKKFSQKTMKEKLIDEIITGLNQVMTKKPKYPNLSMKESYLKFFSIFLKMRNPIQSQNYRQINQQKLTQYLKQTQLIKKVKYSFKSRINWTKKQEQEFVDQIKQITINDNILQDNKMDYFKKKLY